MAIVMCVRSLTPGNGLYLKSFDPEAGNGRGHVEFTMNVKDAMRFSQISDALNMRQTQPKCKPFREDGKPNRPLSATDWKFVSVP